MQRALRSRDRGCRFPGCTHDRFIDAHHIKHWVNGGKISLDNLVLLCRRHHRLVHEGSFLSASKNLKLQDIVRLVKKKAAARKFWTGGRKVPEADA